MSVAQRLGPVAVAVFVAGMLACSKSPQTEQQAGNDSHPAAAPAIAGYPVATAIGTKLCPHPAPCGDDCANVPYVENDCWTTAHGPAAANVVISASGNPQHSTNMLLCDSGPYALCFFSGPPDATGTGSANNALPCVVAEGADTASCSCQYYGSGVSFVDINGIRNQNAYYQAVNECGHDGAKCANMAVCGSGPKVSSASCAMPEASVCQYIREQNAELPDQSLVPGYDTISTFSLAMAKDYDMTNLPSCKGAYLGCMTAPCSFPEGVEAPKDGSVVQCDCPIARGEYQIGQSGADITCAIADGADGSRYLWSAARTVTHGDPEQRSDQ